MEFFGGEGKAGLELLRRLAYQDKSINPLRLQRPEAAGPAPTGINVSPGNAIAPSHPTLGAVSITGARARSL